MYQSDGRVYVHCRVGEEYLDACVVPTVRHGGGGILFLFASGPTVSVLSSDARLHVNPIHFLARRAVC